jgi:hypothetical protein
MAEIVFDIARDFPAPHGLNIYRLRRPEAGEEAVRRIGARFGLRATPETGTFVLSARGSAYSEPSGWGLNLLRASGGWRFRHAQRWQTDDGRSNLNINDEEASLLARDALARYALPAPPEIEPLRMERLRVAHAERGGGHHQERVIGVRAFFGRRLDGLPVEGPGGKTIVYLDQDRELSGIDHLWREIDHVYAPVTGLRPVEEALQEVRRRYGSGEGRVTVTKLELSYYELGWQEEQSFLQPAYVFTLQIGLTDSRFRMNAMVPVAAAVNAVGPIETQLAPAAPQERRLR